MGAPQVLGAELHGLAEFVSIFLNFKEKEMVALSANFRLWPKTSDSTLNKIIDIIASEAFNHCFILAEVF